MQTCRQRRNKNTVIKLLLGEGEFTHVKKKDTGDQWKKKKSKGEYKAKRQTHQRGKKIATPPREKFRGDKSRRGKGFKRAGRRRSTAVQKKEKTI